MPVWRFKAVAENGEVFNLLNEDSGPIFIEESGISGMVATRAESSFQVVGRDGQTPTVTRFDPLKPQLNLVFREWQGKSCGDVVAGWLAAWSKPVTLMVEGSIGSLWAVCRRPRDAGFDAWEYQPDEAGVVKMPWPMVSDDGLWFKSMSQTGPKVLVDNWGSGVCCPSIVWNGAGGTVTAGGDRFVLPAVSQPRRVVLDAGQGYVVTDLAGNVDVALWKRMRSSVRCTPIFPGSSRMFTVPSGALVDWRVGVEHPWW